MPQHDHHHLWNRFLNRVWSVITTQMVREEEILREVKGQTRAVPMQRERRLGFALASDDPLLALIPTCSGDVIRVICAVRMERLLVKEIRVVNGLVKALSLKSACLCVQQEQGSTDPSKIGNHHWSKSGTRTAMRGRDL